MGKLVPVDTVVPAVLEDDCAVWTVLFLHRGMWGVPPGEKLIHVLIQLECYASYSKRKLVS